MRKDEMEIIESDRLIEILNSEDVCRVGFNDRPCPYVVPMNFAYHEGSIYFHSAAGGKKMELLQQDGYVCFEVDHQESIVPGNVACSWGTKYHSIIGTGYAALVEGEERKIKALELLMQKYAGESDFEFTSKGLEHVTVVRISIHEMTGKAV
jgi:nitroimidazol reductase NimA-like FMN-containing flavoprotein (pyridoxamine 5'-phosphate oxidase superfamily)